MIEKNGHNFELKAVKYVAAMSEETHCYHATLYVDGKRFCHVSNRGHGACDDQHAIAPMKYNELMPKIRALGVDLDIVCGELMNQYHHIQGIKKLLKRLSYIEARDSDAIYQVKRAPTLANTAMLKRQAWWKSEFILLNDLTIDEILALPAFAAETRADSIWCDCDDSSGSTYHPDSYHPDTGVRTEKHWWECNDCHKTTQVG